MPITTKIEKIEDVDGTQVDVTISVLDGDALVDRQTLRVDGRTKTKIKAAVSALESHVTGERAKDANSRLVSVGGIWEANTESVIDAV